MINLYANSEVSMFTYYEDTKGNAKCSNTLSGPTDRQTGQATTLFQERLRSVILTESDALTRHTYVKDRSHYSSHLTPSDLISTDSFQLN